MTAFILTVGEPVSEATMRSQLKRFLLEDEGAAATEYAIMLSLILLVIVSTIATLGSKTNSSFNNTASLL